MKSLLAELNMRYFNSANGLRIYKYKSFSLKPENKDNKKCKINNHIFTKKRKCVSTQTSLRFDQNVLAFQIKRTYV